MHVIFPHDSGLCNRLKCIASACRYRAGDEPLQIHWRHTLFTERFSDLFTLEGIHVNEDAEDVRPPQGAFNTWRLLVPEGDPPLEGMYNKTPERHLSAYRAIFARFIPNRTSLAIADSLGRFDYSIHVRSNCRQDSELTPMASLGRWPDTALLTRPISVYVDLLTSLSGRVYMSCHNAQTQAEILAAVPAEHQPVVMTNKDFTSLQHAVADLLVLGHAKHFFAYYGSSFSEVAWWLGGAKATVTEV